MRHCCFINQRNGQPCGSAAAWQVWHGPSPDDYTETCTTHIGEILTDAPEHRIYPITTDEANQL